MKVIAMVPVYNEEDIIEEVIQYLIAQGISLVVLDNGSTDNSYAICQKYLNRGILKLVQIKTTTFQADTIFRMLYDIALTQNPDWVILNAADEFIESGKKNTIHDTINQVGNEGYNLIQFDRFDFFITDDDNKVESSVKKRMLYYSYHGDYLYRAWKYFPGIRLWDTGGHYPIFPENLKYKIFPEKFVLRHYTVRSEEQAKKKMEDRLRGTGYNKQNTDSLNLHYRQMLSKNSSQRFDHKLLTKYNEDGKWNFEMKFIPFAHKNPPKKSDIFTDDGYLKNKPKTVLEYRRLLENEKNKFFPKNIRRAYFLKNKIFRKKNSI